MIQNNGRREGGVVHRHFVNQAVEVVGLSAAAEPGTEIPLLGEVGIEVAGYAGKRIAADAYTVFVSRESPVGAVRYHRERQVLVTHPERAEVVLLAVEINPDIVVQAVFPEQDPEIVSGPAFGEQALVAVRAGVVYPEFECCGVRHGEVGQSGVIAFDAIELKCTVQVKILGRLGQKRGAGAVTHRLDAVKSLFVGDAGGTHIRAVFVEHRPAEVQFLAAEYVERLGAQFLVHFPVQLQVFRERGGSGHHHLTKAEFVQRTVVHAQFVYFAAPPAGAGPGAEVQFFGGKIRPARGRLAYERPVEVQAQLPLAETEGYMMPVVFSGIGEGSAQQHRSATVNGDAFLPAAADERANIEQVVLV